MRFRSRGPAPRAEPNLQLNRSGTEAVAGVTGVGDRLAFGIDDTAATEPVGPDPLRGRSIGRLPARSVGRRAAGDRLGSHDDQQAARSGALQ